MSAGRPATSPSSRSPPEEDRRGLSAAKRRDDPPEPRGKNGFGYDPLFYYPELHMTFAQMLPAVKRQVSHRGKALALAAQAIRQIPGSSREAMGLLGRALLIYAVALALRLRNVRGVFLGDRVLFGYDDPYYHLRRIILTLQHFPRVPAFDSYTNFPDGAVITWPPGFDLLVSLVCWIAGLGYPTHHRVEVVAALFVPFLGAAAAVVVLLLGEEIFGRARWEALAAAGLFAFLPAQQAISTVGRLDHHVLEMPAFGMALLFTLRGLRDDPGSRYSFWGGLALAAGTFCWTGSILFAGFLTLFALGQMVLDRVHGRTESSAGRSALRVLFWGAVLLVPLVLLSPGNGKREFTYLLLSWYQPALLGAAAFVVPALSEVIFAAGRRRAVLRASSGAVATTLLLVAAGWILRRGTGGFQFLSRRDRVISLLVESHPVWELHPGQLVEYFSPLLYAAPLAAALLLRDVFPRPLPRRAHERPARAAGLHGAAGRHAGALPQLFRRSLLPGAAVGPSTRDRGAASQAPQAGAPLVREHRLRAGVPGSARAPAARLGALAPRERGPGAGAHLSLARVDAGQDSRDLLFPGPRPEAGVRGARRFQLRPLDHGDRPASQFLQPFQPCPLAREADLRVGADLPRGGRAGGPGGAGSQPAPLHSPVQQRERSSRLRVPARPILRGIPPEGGSRHRGDTHLPLLSDPRGAPRADRRHGARGGRRDGSRPARLPPGA
jgi:hypothetical protein